MIRSKKISRLTGTERPSSSLSSRTAPWAVVSPDCIRPVVNPQTPVSYTHLFQTISDQNRASHS